MSTTTTTTTTTSTTPQPPHPLPVTSEPKLDEIVWRSPHLLTNHFGGGVNPNTVLLYFRESPFFDRLSNNSSLWTQAQFNPSLAPLLLSRDALEARLRTMTGVEYMVAHQQPEIGFYVIRRQFRRGRRLPKYDLGERPDGLVAGDGMVEDVKVEAVYFVIGENIYPSPRIGEVLKSRQLTVLHHLRNALKVVKGLSRFTPSWGHHYLPPSTGAVAVGGTTATGSAGGGGSVSSAQQQQQQQQQGGTAGGGSSSAAPSTQSSQGQTPNTTTTSSQPPPPTSQPRPTTTSTIPLHHSLAELRTLPTSLQLSMKFSNEYMDSAPPPPSHQSSQTHAISSSTSSSQHHPPPLPQVAAGGTGAAGGATGSVGSSFSSQATRRDASQPGSFTAGSGGSGVGGKVPGAGGGGIAPQSGPTGAGAAAGGGGGGATGQGAQQGQGGPKLKRRKSKAGGMSPT